MNLYPLLGQATNKGVINGNSPIEQASKKNIHIKKFITSYQLYVFDLPFSQLGKECRDEKAPNLKYGPSYSSVNQSNEKRLIP